MNSATSEFSTNNTTTNMDTTEEDKEKTIKGEEETEPESVIASRLGIPRGSFKRWREAGDLTSDEHWIKEGNAYCITAAGLRRVNELLGLEAGGGAPDAAPVPVIQKIAVRAVLPGAHPRVVRCKLEGTGQMCSVRLTAPRVFASQFRRDDRLEVTPTETDGIYEFDGGRPRRVRI